MSLLDNAATSRAKAVKTYTQRPTSNGYTAEQLKWRAMCKAKAKY